MEAEITTEMEQRARGMAPGSGLKEVSRELQRSVPYMPPAAEVRLVLAIFAWRVPDYREALVETFILLNKPGRNREDYKRECAGWVAGLLHEAAQHENDQVSITVHRLLSLLPDRLQCVLRLRFGFDGHGARTLEQVGEELNLSRERIRQLEQKGLRMLRHPSRSGSLSWFLHGEFLRQRLFAEIRTHSRAPAIFSMWEEDLETQQWLREIYQRALTKCRDQADARCRGLERELNRLRALVRDVYHIPVTRAGLSQRTTHALIQCERWKEVPSIGEVVALSNEELLSIKGLGPKTLAELRMAARRIAENREEEREPSGKETPVAK